MDINTFQEIIDSAIKSEIEARQFYLEVADKVENATIKGMFKEFADEELSHQKILERFSSHKDMNIQFTKVPDYHVSESVDDTEKLSISMKPADAIALAMKKEEIAMRHYTQLAEACTDPDQGKVFRELAEMERGHKAKMERAFVDIGYPEVW